jgi:hypothetical protein
MRVLTSRSLCCAAVAWLSLASGSAAETTLTPAATSWKMTGISKDKDISGIACMPAGAVRRCVIAVDEEVSASIAVLQGTEIRQEARVPLLPAPNKELDAEGAAFDPETGFFYVIGSHGTKRHCCEQNPSSFNVIRFRLKENGSAGAALVEDLEVSSRLQAAMKASSKVGPHVGLCLGIRPTGKQKEKGCPADRRQGANIEGIAIHGKKLYVGLRGPVHDDTAYLMSFDTEQVFGLTPAGTTIAVKLGSAGGPRLGVRDLAAVKSGFLILSGPEDDEPGQAALFHFDPDKGALTPLGRISGLAAEAKPEGLLVLEDSQQRYRVLVISDGVKNGLPTEYETKKPPQ